GGGRRNFSGSRAGLRPATPPEGRTPRDSPGARGSATWAPPPHPQRGGRRFPTPCRPVSLLWIRPANAERQLHPDERRLREFLDTGAGVSESVASLSAKLGVRRARCRQVLEKLVREGVVTRRDFEDIEPLYCRYPSR